MMHNGTELRPETGPPVVGYAVLASAALWALIIYAVVPGTDPILPTGPTQPSSEALAAPVAVPAAVEVSADTAEAITQLYAVSDSDPTRGASTQVRTSGPQRQARRSSFGPGVFKQLERSGA